MKIKLPSKYIVYVGLLVIGVIFVCLYGFNMPEKTSTILVSLGTGFVASALTAGLIDYINYSDFLNKRKYRRKLELNNLSISILLAARGVIHEYSNKNVDDIIYKLKTTIVNDNNVDVICNSIESMRERIKKEIETIRKCQDFLSLSGYFSDQEITFLCMSINYYDSNITTDRAQIVLNNIIKYLDMFKDTF